MLRKRMLLALVFGLPISVIAVGSASYTFRQLSDPCVTWGAGHSVGLPTSGPCNQLTGNSETKMRAIMTMVAVPGVILTAAVLGVWAAGRSRRWPMVIAACLMLLEVFPLVFSFWPLALLAGGGFLYLAVHGVSPRDGWGTSSVASATT
jgi:hypothetical protein